MRILYLTGREIGYPRNEVLLRALRRIGAVDVVRGETGGGILLRSLRLFASSLGSLRSKNYDLVFVGFYGHLLMALVGRLARSPILFDAFISTFDTLTEDRKRFSPTGLPGRSALWLDKFSCGLADAVLLDTPEHRDYFIDRLGVRPDNIYPIPVGCNEDIFYPRNFEEDGPIRVLYYCTYLPLHGAEHVVRSASSLTGDVRYRFRLIGRGPEFERVSGLARELSLTNLDFLPPVDPADLAEEIGRADICLGGHFGGSEKAARVVPGKIYQILACARPLIAGDTPANRRFLSAPGSTYFCPPEDPGALAHAISQLAGDPSLRQSLAAEGRRVFEEKASEVQITREIAAIVGRLTG